jgi:electron transfer flavoprotein alpha subunit
MPVLVLAEHDDKSIRPTTLPTVTAAAKAGGEVHVLVVGHNAGDVANEAAKIGGVSKVLLADGAQFADGLAEPVAAQVVAVIQSGGAYSHVFAPATSYGKNILPRVAASLDVAQISDIIGVDSPDTFTRPIYAGNAIATVQSSDAVKVVTARPTNFDPAPNEGGTAKVEKVDAVAGSDASRFVSRDVVKSDRPELQGAKVVVSGGRGIGSAENFKLLEPLADKLNAAIGASRAAVDAGYAPNDWQVGQTGKVVAPQLYIAVGISGAIQHLAGMKDSKVIVAINKDPEAPIFQIADYGLVGDLFEVVPQVVKELG